MQGVTRRSLVQLRVHDGAKRRQGFVDRFPDSPLLNVLVVMPVDVAGTSYVLPRDFRKPCLEGRRQPPRRFGNDFEAARRRVKGLIVAKETIKVEAINKAHRSGNVVAYVLQ